MMGWTDITNMFLFRPNCVTLGVGRIEFFVLGTNGAMYHISLNAVSTYGAAEAVAGRFSDVE